MVLLQCDSRRARISLPPTKVWQLGWKGGDILDFNIDKEEGTLIIVKVKDAE